MNVQTKGPSLQIPSNEPDKIPKYEEALRRRIAAIVVAVLLIFATSFACLLVGISVNPPPPVFILTGAAWFACCAYVKYFYSKFKDSKKMQ
jgi:uncharacterized RDD family membrane protein YckC